MSLHKIVSGVSIAVLVSGINLSSAAEVLKITEVQPEGYPNVVALENLGKKLAAATNGRLTTQMFANGSLLSSEKEMIEQAQVGAIQIARTSLGVLGAIVPDVNVFNIPFVFRDEAHMRQVIDGPIGDELLQKITDSSIGIVGLGWMDSGTRNLFTKKPVKTPADLKGMKIRMMGNPLFIETMNAMGGNGISLPHGEVFSALQTGIVDGAENNEPTYFVNNWYTQAKNYNYTGHLIIPEVFIFSKITWNKLSKEDQELIKKLSREVQMEQRKLWDEKIAAVREQMVKEGVIVNNQVDKKAFYGLTAPVRAKYGASFTDLIKRIEDVR
jgi:tripartite ATP-independent transporter DctP family solute receptor